MHSSRIRTGRCSIRLSRLEGVRDVCPGVGCLPRGWGVCPGVSVLGCLPRGVSARGVCPGVGCLPRGRSVCPGVSVQGCLPRGVAALGCLTRGGVFAQGEGCLPRAVFVRSVCLGVYTCPLWTEFLTHACENITFPQLRLRTVISKVPNKQVLASKSALAQTRTQARNSDLN